MNEFLHGVARAFAETFELPGPIVEIGAYQVAGQEEIADLRGYFPDKEYLGVDMRQGPGVDCVANVESLPWDDGTVGTVIAMSTFEHVQRFWLGFDEIFRVLRPDGALLVSCPFYFHVHSYPSDYWRFTPPALHMLLADYPSKIIGWHGPENRPANVWALALREEAPEITPGQFARYEDALASYGRQPMGWTRKLRYHIGSMLFGKRPFAPYLELDRSTSMLLNQGSSLRETDTEESRLMVSR